MAKITTSQIAEMTNLSRNTVSKALNNSNEVSEKTKELVISTAIKMGYDKIDKKNYSKMAEKIVKDICVLVHERELKNNFWGNILKGIEEHLTVKKFRIVLGILSKIEENELRIPPLISGNKPSGIIMMGAYNKEYYLKIKETGIPVVSIDTASDVKDNALIMDTILSCNQSCVYEITEHLIKKGCREIAFAGDLNHARSVRERWDGYKTAMNDYGIPISNDYLPFNEIVIGEEVNEIIDKIKNINKIPEAIVCANDNVANKIVYGLYSKGLSVPDQVAVSGFDNYDAILPSSIKLTTVGYKIEELGMLAAKQILFRIKHPDVSLVIIKIESHVILRESTEGLDS
ncbi:MAG: LacI family DNA-binding transcriptional regulator [Oscillospiraceae bacterium]|nr:LacI family DNA-binding transcriptional regulator [Oscillospiraceae bacterium]MDD3832495.1 LacI family DNA-binding transcriptional regulator [Oscillospiraceae bacterium]MDD4546338.1 LacI family DNA-binding transcriptional regulator [Oscillospiraceae bacterium]